MSTRPSILALGIATLLAVSSAPGANIAWDTTSGDSSVTGGSGTWDTSANNWTADSGTSNIAWNNSGNNVAVFGSVASPSSVTLTSGITVSGLTFNASDYTITGNTLTLATGSGSPATITVTNLADTVTISSNLVGDYGLAKAGSGSLILSGAYTGTGSLVVNSGTLVLDYTTDNTNKASSTSALSMAPGAKLQFTGNSSADTSQNFRGIALLGSGVSTISAVTQAGRTLTTDFTFNSGVLTRTTTSTLDVIISGSGTAQLKLPGIAANTTVVPWATYNTTVFAGTDSNGYLKGSSSANATATDLNTWVTGGTQYTTTASDFTGSVGADVSIDGITFKDAAVRTVTIGSGNTLALNQGIIVAAGVGGAASTITGGSLIGPSSGPLTLLTNDTSNSLIIASNIVDGSGPTAPSKYGAGSVVLAGANTYTGATTVNGGVLGVTGSLIGAGGIAINSGAMNVSGSLGSANNYAGTIANAGTFNWNGTTPQILSGQLTGSGSYSFNSGTATLSGGGSLMGSSNPLNIVPSDAGTTLNITAGSYGIRNFSLFQNNLNNSTATYNQSGGSVNVTSNFILGNSTAGGSSNNTNTANFKGGTFTAATIQLYKWANSLVNISGGASVKATTLYLGWVDSSPTGTITVGDGLSAGTLSWGDLTIQTNRNYTLSVDGGILKATKNNVAWLPSGTFAAMAVKDSGGTIDNGGFSVTIGQTISHGGTNPTDGGLTIKGGGSTTLTGKNSYTGGTTIANSTVTFAEGALGTTGPIKMNGGTLRWDPSNSEDISSRLVMVNGITATLDTNGNNVIMPGSFGAGTTAALTKIGNGRLTLAGTNTYTGATNVNAGALNLTGSLTSSVTLASGTTLTGSGVITGDITFNAGSGIVASSTLAGVKCANVIATSAFPSTFVYTSDAPASGAQSVNLVRYTGAAPDTSKFIGTQYRNIAFNDSGLVSGTGTITMSYSGYSQTWNQTSGGTWDVNSSTNWTGSPDSKFYWGDSVSFGDTAANQLITLNDDVVPASVTVNNSTANYSFGGNGRILGPGSLTKAGSGILSISNSNNYTGGTVISAGILQFNSPGAAGTGAITLGDSNTGASPVRLTFGFGGVGTPISISNPITVSVGGTGTVTIEQTLSTTLAGLITLNRPTTFISSASSGISGKITGNVGTLTFSGPKTTLDNSVPNDFLGDVVVASAALQTNMPNGIPTTASVTLNGSSRLLLNNGYSQAIDALNGGTSDGIGVQNISSTSVTLTLGSNGGTGSFDGVLTDMAAQVNAWLSIVKVGSGTQTLNGSSSYRGNTTVNGGTLVVNGSLNGSFYSVATVNLGATLAGHGTVSAVTTVQGGILSPGDPNSTGTLRLTRGLTFDGGGTLKLEINTTASNTDLLAVTGALNFGTTAPTLSLTDLGSNATLANGTKFTLITYTGTWDGNLFKFGGNTVADDSWISFGANTYAVDYNDGGNSVSLTVVPEPGVLMALLGGTATLLGLRRRRS